MNDCVYGVVVDDDLRSGGGMPQTMRVYMNGHLMGPVAAHDARQAARSHLEATLSASFMTLALEVNLQAEWAAYSCSGWRHVWRVGAVVMANGGACGGRRAVWIVTCLAPSHLLTFRPLPRHAWPVLGRCPIWTHGGGFGFGCR